MKFRIKQLSAKQEYYSQRKGEPFRHNNKAYVWVSGESVLDNLINRHSRPYKFYQKEVLPVIIQEVLKQHPEFEKDLSPNPKHWGWRSKCGCSMCPCIPGFIQVMGTGTITVSAEVEFYEEAVASLETV